MSATEMPGIPPEAMDEGLRLVVPGRSLGAGAGWDWIVAGWKLFARAPVMWIIAIVVLFIVALLLNFIPLLGSIVYQLLQAVFAAGFVAACRSLERGGEFELEHLFAGFTRRFVSLLIVGLLTLLGWVVILLVFAMFVGFSILGAALTGSQEMMLEAMLASTGMLLLGALVAMLLALPLLAAYWFAPALVLMHDMAPVEAMKASFGASFRNIVPFLVYGIVMLVLAILAVIPFGLGMLVWLPLMIASTYAAYRQIFTEDAEAPLPARAGMV